jgi:hypothetical protein
MQVRSLVSVLNVARDRQRLAGWYRFHFGIEDNGDGTVVFPVQIPNARGFLVVPAPASDDAPLDPDSGPFAVMFFVNDLRGLLLHLDGEGVQLHSEAAKESGGLFGVVTDPENNRVLLWQMQ